VTQKILTRNFVLACFAQFAFASVFHILIPTLPIYLSRSGSKETEIGVLIGSLAISSLIFRPLVGKALIKTPEKNFMIVGTLCFASASLAYLFAPPFWPFMIVRILQGIGFAFFSTAAFTLIANISPEAHRGQSVSYFFMIYNLAGALAPPLGISLINHYGFTPFFLICSALSLCSLFIVCNLGKRRVLPAQDSSLESGFFLSKKAIPPSIIYSFSLFIWGALATFFPLYAINHGVANPGFFFTTVAIVLILGQALGGKILDLYDKEKIILLCFFTYTISMIILAFSKTLPMFILVAVIFGIGHAFFGPTLVAYALARGSSPGPVMGTFLAITDLGFTLGPAIMGVVIHWTSYPTMFLCLAFTGPITLNYFYFFVRKKGNPSTVQISTGNR
jgi:MFS family permease